jgi:predicted nucleotidyltransferase
MPQTPKNVADITQLVATWCRRQPVRLCVLFGSQATGKTHPNSDVDLAVWPGDALPTATRLRWLRELQDLLDKEVSLVIVSPDLDPVLGFEIVRSGRLVFEQTPGTWHEYRLHLWHAYNDSLPFRRAAQQSLRRFAEQVKNRK